MPQAHATDSLSETGRATMLRGFAAGWAARRIVQAVKDETGELVTERTVARRASEWRNENLRRAAARQRMEDLVAAMKAGGMAASEMVQALAMDHLVEHPEALTGADPIELHGLSMDAEKVRLKRAELELRARAIAVNEKKLAILEERERRVLAVAGGDGEKRKMTDAERIEEIRGIYGLAS